MVETWVVATWSLCNSFYIGEIFPLSCLTDKYVTFLFWEHRDAIDINAVLSWVNEWGKLRIMVGLSTVGVKAGNDKSILSIFRRICSVDSLGEKDWKGIISLLELNLAILNSGFNIRAALSITLVNWLPDFGLIDSSVLLDLKVAHRLEVVSIPRNFHEETHTICTWAWSTRIDRVNVVSVNSWIAKAESCSHSAITWFCIDDINCIVFLRVDASNREIVILSRDCATSTNCLSIFKSFLGLCLGPNCSSHAHVNGRGPIEPFPARDDSHHILDIAYSDFVLFIVVRKLNLDELSLWQIFIEQELIKSIDGLAVGVLESDEILFVLHADHGGGCLRHRVTASQSNG